MFALWPRTMLTVNDSYGDYIAAPVVGSFELSSGDTVLASGGEFASSTSANFASTPRACRVAQTHGHQLQPSRTRTTVRALHIVLHDECVQLRRFREPRRLVVRVPRAGLDSLWNVRSGLQRWCLATDMDGICDERECAGCQDDCLQLRRHRHRSRGVLHADPDSTATEPRCAPKTSTTTAPWKWDVLLVCDRMRVGLPTDLTGDGFVLWTTF